MQQIMQYFFKYLKMYIKLRQEMFTNADLIELEVNIIDIFKYQPVELIR